MMLRKSTLLSFVLFIFLQLQLLGQAFPPVEFNVTSGEGVQGSQVCLTITANNFTNVESVQLNLSFNAALVVPKCPDSASLASSALIPNIDVSNFNCANASNGFINFVWVNSPTTIPDGSILFTLCFDLIGEPGNISPVYFNGQLLDIEIGQVDNNGVGYTTEEIVSNVGTIKIISNTLATYYKSCDADMNNPSAGGSLSFYATAGMPPYSYSITPGPINGTMSLDGERVNLPTIPMGIYTLKVTDALGAMVTKSPIIISSAPLLTLDTIVKRPTCFNKRNGSIKLENIQGGIPPYSYQWSNLLSGLDFIDNLPISTYTVTITDFNGCAKTEVFDLNIDTLKYDVAVRDSATCLGIKDGVITISNVKGGTTFAGAFDYKYSVGPFGNPKPFNSPTDVTGVAAGMNIVRVLDSLGCIVEKTIDMPFKKTVKIDTILFDNVSCFGLKDGEVRFKASPGSGYGYTPSLNILNSGNLGGVFIASDLDKGNYSVTARDAAGCTSTVNFTITEPQPIVLNAVEVKPDCANAGSITLNPTGGTGAYTYLWSPDAGNVSQVTNLQGGNYNVTVTDINNCKEVASFIFNNVGTLNMTIVKADETCEGKNDGMATATFFIPGQLPTYEIFWRDGNGVLLTVKTSGIKNLAPGNYTVQIITADGCDSGERPFVILPAPSITIITKVTNALCFGVNGQAEVTVSGSSAGFTYEWRVKGTNVIIDNDNILDAMAGTYLVKAISPAGCIGETEVLITSPNMIVVPAPQTRNVTCYGLSNGQAAILSGPANLIYTWSTGEVAPFAINFPAGKGWVIASDGFCTSDTVFFTIGQFPLLEIDDSKTLVVNPVCYGENNGSVTIIAKGGSGVGYTYKWDSGISGPTLTNVTAGAYIITISDDKNCVQTDTFLLTQPDKLEAILDKTKTVELDCNNQDGGKIGLMTSGGNPGIKTITWQSGVITDANIAIGLSPGTYCATVSDNFGCKDTICHTLTAPAPLVGELNVPVEPLCNGGETCISVKSLTGGTGNKYTFQINNGIRYPLDSCVTVFAGQYFVNLIDSAGCSISKTIVIGQPDPLNVDLGPDLEVQLGLTSPTINAYIDAPLGIDTLVWTPSDDINCVSLDCSAIEVIPTETTTYQLVVTDINGCIGSDDITIKVKNVRNVYFANIFTPNRDGDNDHFQAVIGPGVERIIAFSIYDRWGNLVFNKSNFVPDPAGTDGWDGTFGGRRLDPGVFVFTAKALFIDGKILDYSGSVTLADKVRN